MTGRAGYSAQQARFIARSRARKAGHDLPRFQRDRDGWTAACTLCGHAVNVSPLLGNPGRFVPRWGPDRRTFPMWIQPQPCRGRQLPLSPEPA